MAAIHGNGSAHWVENNKVESKRVIQVISQLAQTSVKQNSFPYIAEKNKSPLPLWWRLAITFNPNLERMALPSAEEKYMAAQALFRSYSNRDRTERLNLMLKAPVSEQERLEVIQMLVSSGTFCEKGQDDICYDIIIWAERHEFNDLAKEVEEYTKDL